MERPSFTCQSEVSPGSQGRTLMQTWMELAFFADILAPSWSQCFMINRTQFINKHKIQCFTVNKH